MATCQPMLLVGDVA